MDVGRNWSIWVANRRSRGADGNESRPGVQFVHQVGEKRFHSVHSGANEAGFTTGDCRNGAEVTHFSSWHEPCFEHFDVGGLARSNISRSLLEV